MKRNTLAEILERLASAGWLDPNKNALEAEERVKAALVLMKGSQLMRSIEFSRAVHAEVAALLDAALRGVGVGGCTLYTTTFPCHDCARHIVAAGISRVRYIEPYPKSFAMEFHDDSIAVDQAGDPETSVSFRPFVGIAPSRYMDFFDISAVKRKDEDGTITDWGRMRQSSTPKLIDLPPTYLIQEEAQLSEIVNKCDEKRLM